MQNPDFSHLHVEFFMDAIPDPIETAKQGRPIFYDKERVRIRFAGDKHQVFVADADQGSSVRDPETNLRLTYAQVHSAAYEAFKKGVAYAGTGTPLAELPFLTESQRKELRALNIHTAEALAALDGQMLSRVGMFGRQMKTQAQAYIDQASKMAGVNHLAQENEELRARLERLEGQIMAGGIRLPATEDQPDRHFFDDNTPDMASNSPFADWQPEAIRTWLKENRGPTPGPNTSFAKLLKVADEHNAALKAEKEVA